MATEIKKRQHYVWRHYLKAWSDNESIWTYFKTMDKIEKPSLMGVAQEKFFYKLIDLTDEEENFLKNFIDRDSPKQVKALNSDFLSLFTSTRKLKQKLTSANHAKINKESFEKKIREMEANLMEDGHCKMEELGFKLLRYRSLDDLKTIENDDYIFDAIMFMCFQYFRTKSIKTSVLNNFKGSDYENIATNCWNILSYCMATKLATRLSLGNDIRFVFVINNNTTHFITGDQPIFNILNDKLDKNGEVAELELYYPITPNHALRVHFDLLRQADKYIEELANEEAVNHLNKKVFENSDFYVFADSEEQLKIMIPTSNTI